ncbi:MAG: hypothetical protein IPK19_00105 [Chloroflexi bacterium]|nr:hypothetical protein [Chloroflexota bacterium]
MSIPDSISADGRFVAFSSPATDLVAGDTNTAVDVFVHDQETGQTIRASIASNGSQANLNASEGAISQMGTVALPHPHQPWSIMTPTTITRLCPRISRAITTAT